jgi:hypothetical protein
LGRFISVDPIMDVVEPQQMHGYSHANNNPVTWSDPTGLLVFTSCPDGVCAPERASALTRTPVPTTRSILAATMAWRRPSFGNKNGTIAAYDKQGAYVNGVQIPRMGVSPHQLAQRLDQNLDAIRRVNLWSPKTQLSFEQTLVAIGQYCYRNMDFCGRDLYRWAVAAHMASLGTPVGRTGIAGLDSRYANTYAGAPRLPQDERVSPKAPQPRKLNRDVGGSPSQNEFVQSRIATLLDNKAIGMRLDQHQVNADGDRVGINRPDLQYTINRGRRYEEYDTSRSNRGPMHAARILANDPASIVYLYTID